MTLIGWLLSATKCIHYLALMQTLKQSKKKELGQDFAVQVLSQGKRRWLRAVKLVKDRGDPWERFHLDTIKTETGRRHRCTAPFTITRTHFACRSGTTR